MGESVYVTNRTGQFIEIADRVVLREKNYQYSLKHQDTKCATLAVHIMLVNRRDELRIVQRSDTKAENPGLWDKSVGGTVRAGGDYDSIPLRDRFDRTLVRELAEELKIENVVIAQDAIEYYQLVTASNGFQKEAVVRLIDYDPWWPSLRRMADGSAWWKRSHVATYVGVYEGQFDYVDKEAQAHKCIPRTEILETIRESPQEYTYDLRLLVRRYYHLLRVGVSDERDPEQESSPKCWNSHPGL